MSTSGNLDTLVERVLDQARRQAASAVELAGKAAEREVLRAEKQCLARRQTVETAARELAERQKNSALMGIRMEERRALMNAKEAAVEEVFAEALRDLSVIRDPAARLDLLARLVAEGVRALREKNVRVRLNAAERRLAEASGFPKEIEGATVAIARETIETSGGPVVTDAAGRVIFENTFEARLDRKRESLRRLAAEALHLQDKEGAG